MKKRLHSLRKILLQYKAYLKSQRSKKKGPHLKKDLEKTKLRAVILQSKRSAKEKSSKHKNSRSINAPKKKREG